MDEAQTVVDPGKTSEGRTGPAADDLLAEFAGKEIDRLLAQDELGVSPPESAAAPLDDAPGLFEPVTGARLDDSKSAASGASAGGNGGDANAAHLIVNDSAALLDPVPAPLSAGRGAESQGLDSAGPRSGELSPASDSADATSEAEGEEEETALPPYLKPLEWLNAPFSMMSDELRNALGKIAIATLVNATAVLVYVVRFRHK